MSMLARLALAVLAVGLCAAAPPAEPLPPAKQIVIDFFGFSGTREARTERFLDEGYIQHNPRFLKMDAATGQRGRAAWLAAGPEGQRRGVRLVDQGIALRNPILLMAEGDVSHAIYRGRIAHPTRPGESYEAFAFETFRVRDGRFVEHWDGVRLAPGWAVRTAAGEQPPVVAPEPAVPCTAPDGGLEANKRLVARFLAATPAGRAGLVAPGYRDHDPRPPAERTEGPRNEVLTLAECDLVTVLWKLDLPDPEVPGGRYEAFTFDTFRVRDGRLAEHWNDAVLDGGP